MTLSKYAGITVLLADDQPLLRKGLKSVIHNLGVPASILEAQSGKEALDLAKKFPINLFIMDHQISAGNGQETLRMIIKSNSNARIIIMTKFNDRTLISNFSKIGVKEVVNKNSTLEQIEHAIKSSLEGLAFYNPIDEQLDIKRPLIKFTKREREIIERLGKGLTSQAISKELGLALKTVETYRCRLLEKVNVKNTSELLIFVHRNGLI